MVQLSYLVRLCSSLVETKELDTTRHSILQNLNVKVILACQSLERGNAAVKKIRAITGNKQVSTMRVDMSSMADINRFAKDFKLQEGRCANQQCWNYRYHEQGDDI